ncbi:uncharacterized protein [Montipora capricornis]|uniref:uncharacterized protein n=1 Tax=Montipora capricornis TaxID=246305 RepID=UPI0035F197AF
MYVDDVLDSCETVEEATNLRNQLSDLLSMASFKLRKWSSNETAVLEDAPVEDRQPSLEIREEGTPKIKTLGVMWETERDIFTFQVELPSACKEPTKRNVLSAIAALFDPLQFLSPFTMRATVLMQEIWMAGIDWDDVLPKELTIKCEKWVSELPDPSHIAIPLCLRLANPEKVDLHLFSDASKDAFISSAYLVCYQPNWRNSAPTGDAKKCEDLERLKTTSAHLTYANPRINPNEFSSLNHLVRVTGWVRRFADNCRLPQGSRRNARTLIAAEMLKAETFWLKQAQNEAFPRREEEGSLARFSPKKDDEGLLLVDGCLRLADYLTYNAKHPILLLKDHGVTRLVVTDTHERLGHGSGVDYTLTELRAPFVDYKGETSSAKHP